jgi:hypothetical protein
MMHLTGAPKEGDSEIRSAASDETYLASLPLATGRSESQRQHERRLSYTGTPFSSPEEHSDHAIVGNTEPQTRTGCGSLDPHRLFIRGRS